MADFPAALSPLARRAATHAHDELVRWASDRRLAAPDAAAAALLAQLVRGPLPYSDSSMRLSSIQSLCNVVALGDATRVVELGGGTSTLLLASLLADLGSAGRVTSVEHDAEWLAVMRRLVARWGLRDRVDLVLAPLRGWRGGAGALQAGRWYDTATLHERLPDGIDLLVVDGPPAYRYADRFARYPALPELADRLGPGSVVVLDDVNRWGERHVFRAWRRGFGSRLIFEPAARTARIGVARGPGTWTI